LIHNTFSKIRSPFFENRRVLLDFLTRVFSRQEIFEEFIVLDEFEAIDQAERLYLYIHPLSSRINSSFDLCMYEAFVTLKWKFLRNLDYFKVSSWKNEHLYEKVGI
jgi:hypothetical protein